jgi:hypothetical protein
MMKIPLIAEFVSSFIVCTTLLLLDVQTKALETRIDWSKYSIEFDAEIALVTLLFIELAVVFAPTYARASKGATNNPTVYVLRAMLGEMSVGRAVAGALTSVSAHVVAFATLLKLTAAYPSWFKGKAAMVPIFPAGGFKAAAMAEFAVAAANFLFFGVAEKTFSKSLLPALGSGFYVMTAMLERCRYSCGFMNPSVVIASHVIAGDVATREAFEAIGAYVVGGVAACAVVAIAAKILTPEPPSAKRARLTSKVAIRSISRAREKREKEMARSASKSKKL